MFCKGLTIEVLVGCGWQTTVAYINVGWAVII